MHNYGTFLTKFQPECSQPTCSFMWVFTVLLFHPRFGGFARTSLQWASSAKDTRLDVLRG